MSLVAFVNALLNVNIFELEWKPALDTKWYSSLPVMPWKFIKISSFKDKNNNKIRESKVYATILSRGRLCRIHILYDSNFSHLNHYRS